MSRKNLIYIYIAIILVIVALIVYREIRPQADSEMPGGDVVRVESFDECAAAGYPIAESYPARCTVPGGDSFTQDIGNELEKQDRIRLDSPRPTMTVSSPLIIKGEARGTWYFEASFPYRLEDEAGATIAQGSLQATGDWMTENFVPFEGMVEFDAPAGQTGRLVLERNNASGLPEHDEELIVPITFGSPGTDTSSVTIFLPNDNENPDSDCAVVFPVQRTIPKTLAIGRAALEELIAGPTEAEKAAGFSTTVPATTAIKSLVIDADGTARVDFSADLEENAAGSCYVTALRAQIEQTLRQFPTVKKVIISVEGRSDDILQP